MAADKPTDKQRRALELRKLRLTWVEIGRRLNVAPETARQYAVRAEQKLNKK